MTVTPIPTLNATELSDNFTYLGTTTSNYGGPIVLLATWLIGMSVLGNYPLHERVRASTFMTMVLSLLFQAIDLSFPQVTGILVGVLVLNEIYARMTQPNFG